MEESGAGADGLRSGQRVRARVRGHQPWGLVVEIAGHEGIGASIDYLDIAGPRRGWSRPDDFPVGAEIEVVIANRLAGPEPPRWYYLKTRAAIRNARASAACPTPQDTAQ